MNELKSPIDARNAFGIQETDGYHDFIPFEGGKPGFSIKRTYPENIQFKPPVTKSGIQDTVAMIRVLFNPENLSAKELDPSKIPLWVDINKHSKYHYSHFGFNHEDQDCPTAESLAASRETPQPVDLTFPNKFFFDNMIGEFRNTNGQKLSGLDVLRFVYDQHCNPVLKSPRRVWASIAHIGITCNYFTCGVLDGILRFCFRKRFDKTQSALRPFKREDIVLLEADSLEILGYKTTKNVILTYAVMSLLFYGVALWAGLSKFRALTEIWNHPFLGLCATLVTLAILEHLGPQLIRYMANILRRIRGYNVKQ